MSLIIWGDEESGLISYRDYILSEGIAPKSINYGTNQELNNNSIITINDTRTTFLNIEDSIYIVSLDSDGQIGFGFIDISLKTFKSYNLNNKNHLDLVLRASSDKIRDRNLPGLKTFGFVFFVIIKIISFSKLEGIWFESGNKQLDSIYALMVKNKLFLKNLQDLGYEYDGNLRNAQFFKKIKGE